MEQTPTQRLVLMVVVIILAIISCFMLLVVIFPNPDFDPLAARRDKNRDLYRRVTRFGMLAFLPVWSGATLAFRVLLYWLVFRVQADVSGARFLLRPSTHLWWLIAMFLGMLLAALVVHIGLKYRLGSAALDYAQFERRLWPFDAKKLMPVLIAFIIIAITIGIVCGMQTYAAFYDNRIVIRAPLDLRARSYSYGDIKTIYSVEKVVNYVSSRRDPHFVIDFSDGWRWTSRTNLRDPDSDNDQLIAQWLVKRTGQSMINVVALGD